MGLVEVGDSDAIFTIRQGKPTQDHITGRSG